jgi:L-alanine-DL-glutamate epimerase-like enolase superfamily enzyme
MSTIPADPDTPAALAALAALALASANHEDTRASLRILYATHPDAIFDPKTSPKK